MNEVEKQLLRTRRALSDVCDDLGIDIEEAEIDDIDQCSSCSIWQKHSQLRIDLDGNPICNQCWQAYGD